MAAKRVLDETDDNIGWLLLRALRSYNRRAVAGIRARGHELVGLAHAAVLPYITADGVRVTHIAQAAGMSKQAVSQLLKELESAGYITRVRDKLDKRAERITFTELGKQLHNDARKVKKKQESEIAAVLGSTGKAKLAKMLRAFPWQA